MNYYIHRRFYNTWTTAMIRSLVGMRKMGLSYKHIAPVLDREYNVRVSPGVCRVYYYKFKDALSDLSRSKAPHDPVGQMENKKGDIAVLEVQG